MVHIEGHFGQADHVHPFAVLGLGQGGRGSQPTGVAAHNLHDGHVFGAVHRGVPDDLLHDHADVLGGTAITGGVVGDHQVVVNGLGYAHKADLAADVGAVIGQLADGIHRVVAADIEEVADVQLLQDLKQLQVDSFPLGGMPVGQLIAAAAQVAGGRTLKQLNVQCVRQLIIQHTGAPLQQTGHYTYIY